MSRLEMIHLRTAGRSFDCLVRQIHEAIGSDVDDSGVVTVYRRSGFDTDVAVHITCHGRGGTASPSALGTHLASALSSYGLVVHTVWGELT